MTDEEKAAADKAAKAEAAKAEKAAAKAAAEKATVRFLKPIDGRPRGWVGEILKSRADALGNSGFIEFVTIKEES